MSVDKNRVQVGQSDGGGGMFDRIADRYDLLNRVMSLGMDGRWRRKLVAALALEGAGRALDVATGTGDVALAIAKTHAEVRVVGLDPSEGMLAVGRKKAAARGLDRRVILVAGDAQAMPWADDHFDAACISFGIRNVPDRAQGLREMARVTRRGGRVVVLELGEPKTGLMAPLARFHIRQVVPRLGGWLSGDEEYRYLQRSIAAFPSAQEFAGLMAACGLAEVTVTPLAFGAANLYVGEVP